MLIILAANRGKNDKHSCNSNAKFILDVTYFLTLLYEIPPPASNCLVSKVRAFSIFV